MKVLTLITICVASALCGCTTLGNFNSVHRKLDTSNRRGVLVDIKQRAILVGSDENDNPIICAEPSPDALSAYAAEIAAKVDRPELISAQLTAATQEGASFVGLRTSTIQLLRDSMYRLCEAHMNGAIDRNSYNFQLRKYQRQLVALLAIEQLTGAQRAKTSAIETRSATRIARDIKTLQAESDGLKNQIDAIDAKLKDAKENKDTLTAERKELTGRKIDVDAAIAHERELLLSGATQVKFASDDSTLTSKSDHDLYLYNTVLQIVQMVTDRNDTETQCFLLLIDRDNPSRQPTTGTSKKGPVYSICEKILADYTDNKHKEELSKKDAEIMDLKIENLLLSQRLNQTQTTSASSSRSIDEMPNTRASGTEFRLNLERLNQLLRAERAKAEPQQHLPEP